MVARTCRIMYHAASDGRDQSNRKNSKKRDDLGRSLGADGGGPTTTDTVKQQGHRKGGILQLRGEDCICAVYQYKNWSTSPL